MFNLAIIIYGFLHRFKNETNNESAHPRSETTNGLTTCFVFSGHELPSNHQGMVKSVLLTWSVQKYKEPVLFKISKRTKVQRTSTTLSFHQYNVLQFKTVHFSTFENIFSTFSMIFSSFINFSSEKHFATKMCTLKGN